MFFFALRLKSDSRSEKVALNQYFYEKLACRQSLYIKQGKFTKQGSSMFVE